MAGFTNASARPRFTVIDSVPGVYRVRFRLVLSDAERPAPRAVEGARFTVARFVVARP